MHIDASTANLRQCLERATFACNRHVPHTAPGLTSRTGPDHLVVMKQGAVEENGIGVRTVIDHCGGNGGSSGNIDHPRTPHADLDAHVACRLARSFRGMPLEIERDLAWSGENFCLQVPWKLKGFSGEHGLTHNQVRR